MTTMTMSTASTAVAPAKTNRLAGVLSLLRRMGEARRNRLAAEALSSMDDHILRDIGVTRLEAYHLARYGCL